MSETIGIVGMGVMGKNIALNFSDNDMSVVAVSYTHLRAHET